MNKTKQINELAKVIYSSLRSDSMSRALASLLYSEGYRKQSEGEWIIKTYEYDWEYMMCSVCKEEFYPVDEDTVDTTPNYCPNCGAKMKGGVE